ncbi:MAG TPA: PEGA domain-containing protein [Patescibacteria group bacterium]|nr:PEGA domain-containing protein [Patescibacteria group bacterium]
MYSPRRFLISLLGALFILAATLLLIGYGRGWRFNPETRDLSKTGLLSASSWPSGASVFIDGRLTTATDSTVQLPPGVYQVQISKDGYLPWEKSIPVQPELVYETNARLFPAAPELKPLTLTGAVSPVLSPDNDKITYAVASSSAQKAGVWVINMKEHPLSLGGNQRQIVKDTPRLTWAKAKFTWTPDSLSVLASFPDGSNYLLDATRLNTPEKIFDVTATLSRLKAEWEDERKIQEDARLARLPEPAQKIASGSALVKISQDETKLLLQKPEDTDSYLVYDIKDDKTFSIPVAKEVYWLPEPENRHLILVEDNTISVVEYEGTNKMTLYSGYFEEKVAYPWPDGLQLVILTNFNFAAGVVSNLYTLSLR